MRDIRNFDRDATGLVKTVGPVFVLRVEESQAFNLLA
jgi:hypothetical protein